MQATWLWQWRKDTSEGWAIKEFTPAQRGQCRWSLSHRAWPEIIQLRAWQTMTLPLLFCSGLLFCHLSKWDQLWRSPKCAKAKCKKRGVGEKALNELLDRLKPWHVPLPSHLLSVWHNIKGADKGAPARLTVVVRGDTTPKHGCSAGSCYPHSRQRNGTGTDRRLSCFCVKLSPQQRWP